MRLAALLCLLVALVACHAATEIHEIRLKGIGQPSVEVCASTPLSRFPFVSRLTPPAQRAALLPQRAFQEILNTYSIQNPGIAIQYSTVITSTLAKAALVANEVDFALSTTVPSQAEVSKAPDLIAYPFFGVHSLSKQLLRPIAQTTDQWFALLRAPQQAVIPGLKIQGVDRASTVVLSGAVLSALYLGNLTKWNDPRMRVRAGRCAGCAVLCARKPCARLSPALLSSFCAQSS
jgi:hypothetical protein